ncbi:MAG: molecular chaperone HtpG [Nannocystaceae bacterium]|nr:molecular chaperone HtpG [Nannocystaceae bacterium]
MPIVGRRRAMTDTSAPEKHEFKAEVAAVLKLVTHSLYTNREIFLRELISNASDAIDKARYTALVDTSLEGQELEPSVRLSIDAERGVLIIEDNGIGMTQEEARANLGTIAHSGTLAFLEQAAKAKVDGKSPDVQLIGQFGVGFYSAFMVSDRVDVYTRSALPGSEAVHWSSTGDGSFTIAPGDKAGRGTRVEIHLKEDAKEYLERYRLENIVKRYSNFVMYPVQFAVDKEGEDTPEWTQLNEIGAFWTQSASELNDEDYKEFYKHVMGGFVLPGDEPLGRMHLSMDAPIQFHAVLFIPGRRPADLFNEESKHVQLFARRVMVMENCDKLLPSYLRFMRGVVDSEDLPLNVSREMLQENKNLSAIRRQLTRKALRLLSDTAKEDKERYEKVFENFGVFLKEGLHLDSGHKDELTELLRFGSTGHEATWISLREYVDTMPEGQQAIYYVAGRSQEELRGSPHLEALRDRGYAVIMMTDAVDEWVVQDLAEYDGKKLISITAGDLDLDGSGKDEDKDKDESKDDESKDDGLAAELAPLLERATELLEDRVSAVKVSRRLTSSASCLVDDVGGMGRNMERILQAAGRPVSSRLRVLELNGGHAFVKAACALVQSGDDAARADAYIELLHDQAHLSEGEVPDPKGTVARIQSMLDALVAK